MTCESVKPLTRFALADPNPTTTENKSPAESLAWHACPRGTRLKTSNNSRTKHQAMS